jgi:hypothetical protein
MKKILILAYDFPPYVSVGGLRPYNWYKYFREFGVEPIVITRQWSNTYGNGLDYIAPSETQELIIEQTEYGTIYRTPYKPNLSNRLLLNYGDKRFRFIRKAITAYYEFGQFLFPIGPKIELYKAAKSYLKENEVDAILATGEPFILFKYATQLSKEFDTPWIADYRDPWCQNIESQKNKLVAWWNRYQEKRIVKHASYITTVSELLKTLIGSLNKNIPTHIFPNGFDPEMINSVYGIEQGNKELQIAFGGTIYSWHPWKSILNTFNHFIDQHTNARVKLNFYGINNPQVIEHYIATELISIKKFINITPRLENSALVNILAENNAMLLFNDYAILGTKIFDYLGIRRKIIMCYSNDAEAQVLKNQFYTMEEFESESKTLQADLIQQTNSGIIVRDAEHLLKVFEELYAEFQETGQIACNSIGVENYSRKIQVEKLAELIKTV